MPSPLMPIMVIANRKATMAPVLTVVSVRSFKLAPQRLQKLKPGVIVVPQVEQNIKGPLRKCLEESFPAKRNGCDACQVPVIFVTFYLSFLSVSR
jgi:hypothetical protein